MRTRGHSNALSQDETCHQRGRKNQIPYRDFLWIHRLSSGCSRLCSLEQVFTLPRILGSSSAQAETARKQYHCGLSAFVIFWLFSKRTLKREDYRPGEGRATGEQWDYDEWMSQGGSWSPSAQGHSPCLEVRRLLNWPFGQTTQLPNTGLETRKKQRSPWEAHVARKHGSLAQAIVKLPEPLQAGSEREKSTWL